jgi:hypothetical protein
MGAYFAFAAAVQVNDPDAWLWFAFYAVAAAVTFVAVVRTPPWWIPAALTVIAGAWAVALMPAAFESSFSELFRTWKMMSPGMEVGREMLGLIVTAVWMAILTQHVRALEASVRLARAAAERS